MSEYTPVAIAELYPDAPQAAFDKLEQALNMVLPGSDTHERYLDVGEVGLAAVIAVDPPVEAHNYSPFDPTTPSRLAFMANNQDLRPSAWEPKSTDETVLGGPIPIGMGRFTAFAIAKVNWIAISNDVQSYNVDRASIEPGAVGIAGGIWNAGSLEAVSGLWEVHDHMGVKLLEAETYKEVEGNDPERTADDIAADVEAIIHKIKSFHEGVSAADLSREDVFNVLRMLDGYMARYLRTPEED
ncbi:MAG: hypothetical protein ACHQT9_03180 [Candidatus Saccharimonadales bacterium]